METKTTEPKVIQREATLKNRDYGRDYGIESTEFFVWPEYICTDFVTKFLGIKREEAPRKIKVTLSDREIAGGKKINTYGGWYKSYDYFGYRPTYPKMRVDLCELNYGGIAFIWVLIEPVLTQEQQ